MARINRESITTLIIDARGAAKDRRALGGTRDLTRAIAAVVGDVGLDDGDARFRRGGDGGVDRAHA